MKQPASDTFANTAETLIGTETAWSAFSEPIDASEVRRFVHAIMSSSPLYGDESFAAETRYGSPVCPPLYASSAFRRPFGSPDPLDRLRDEPDWAARGGGRTQRQELHPVPHGLVRMVNGGAAFELFKRVRAGTRVRSKERYADIRERIGSSGRLVFITVETIYEDDEGDTLAKAQQTWIWR